MDNEETKISIGQKAYQTAQEIFPICRSITGEGVRETLRILKKIVPELEICEVPSNTEVFDWRVPREWQIREAYIEDEEGNKIVDFKNNNLHVVGYSLPLDVWVDLNEISQYIYTDPDQPDWIPYVTSYYSERSGFCMAHNQFANLKPGKYHLVIDSDLIDGSLTYGEIFIPGESAEEVFFSTYVCHPSMGNNECSGPSLAIWLADFIKSKKRKYSYRIYFGPETIGAITYLSLHLDEMKKNVVAGFNLTCVGDDGNYSLIHTKYGDTLSDDVLFHIMEESGISFKEYSFLERGSDERQYNSVGVDLPVCCFCRTRFGEFPEYHTSADNMNFISPQGFEGSFSVLSKCIEALEHNNTYEMTVLCEPHLSKYGLYSTLSRKHSADDTQMLMDFIEYADGKNTLLQIARIIKVPVWELYPIVEILLECGLLREV